MICLRSLLCIWMTNLMAGKNVNTWFVFLKLYFYNLCSFGEVKRLIKLPLGETKIEPSSTSVFSGLNPFACVELSFVKVLRRYFPLLRLWKTNFLDFVWKLSTSSFCSPHHDHIVMAGNLLKGKRAEHRSQFPCKDSRVCSNVAQLLLKSNRMNSWRPD